MIMNQANGKKTSSIAAVPGFLAAIPAQADLKLKR